MTRIDQRVLDGDTVVLECRGPLTLLESPALSNEIADAVMRADRLVVLDLTDTPRVDSTGLAAVVAGLRLARENGADLRIAGPPESAREILALTQLEWALPPYDSVADAVADRLP